MMARLSPRDAVAWERLGAWVAALVEARLSPGVLAERVVPGVGCPDRSHLLGRLRRARVLAERFAATRDLVSADVRACYPSIDPGVVARSLVSAGGEPEGAARVADMLEGWGSEGYPGLPIGPPASAWVANAVLLQVDRGLGATPYLRWVDDYLLPLGALDRLDEGLEEVGLRRSEEKTHEDRAGVWRSGTDPYPPNRGTR